MITAFESVPILSVEPGQDIKEHLERVAAGDLPGFVMHNAGVDMNEAVAATGARDALVGHGYKLATARDNPLQFAFSERQPGDTALRSPEGYAYGNYSLHMDRGLSADTTLSVHHTSHGVAEASLFEPASYWAAKQLEDVESGAEERAARLFNEGMVDLSLLDQARHNAILTAGSLLIFRLGGIKPLVHAFTSLEHPRISRAHQVVRKAA
ncbi:MAG: hypothetical protein JWL85_902 [Candidatus Saccharibacteria bacterium]|nr:hypothetical protein [Candidatus Saccharibacteria bacterium]